MISSSSTLPDDMAILMLIFFAQLSTNTMATELVGVGGSIQIGLLNVHLSVHFEHLKVVL